MSDESQNRTISTVVTVPISSRTKQPSLRDPIVGRVIRNPKPHVHRLATWTPSPVSGCQIRRASTIIWRYAMMHMTARPDAKPSGSTNAPAKDITTRTYRSLSTNHKAGCTYQLQWLRDVVYHTVASCEMSSWYRLSEVLRCREGLPSRLFEIVTWGLV